MAKTRGLARLAVLAGLFALLVPAAVNAQDARERRTASSSLVQCWIDYEKAVERLGEEAGEPDCRPSRFRLHGEADFAGSGLRTTAHYIEHWLTNTGLSDLGLELSGMADFQMYGTEGYSTRWLRQTYEMQFYAAAPRGDWMRNRAIAHSLQNVTGGGWTAITNFARRGGLNQWMGRDGSVGLYHSGEQAGPEGCLDHGEYHRHYPHGMPLLAGSDCPETWGAAGWVFRRWVGSEDNWLEYFNSLPNRHDFSFDFTRVPEEFQQPTRETVGNFQTFGVMSDHGAEMRELYGNVIPGQTGEPDIEGYPIGINVYFNAYSFEVPKVSGGYVYEGFIVNESEDLYGVPLDYDSLFFGIQVATAKWNRGTMYALPEMGMAVHNSWGQAWDEANNDFTDRFSNAPLQVPGGPGTPITGGARGFRSGMLAFGFLRTPLGDLRNKHFSDPASPFYSPGHPLSGDTITFNHMRFCGTTGYACIDNEMMVNVRRSYGILTANTALTLDGRETRDLDDLQQWRLFNVYWDDMGGRGDCDVNDPRAFGCHGHFVPGVEGDLSPVWTYSNRPPGAPTGPDTLFYSTCRGPMGDHPERNTCVVTWSDTAPDRSLIGGGGGWWMGFGPFPLKAGDSAPVVLAILGHPDREMFFNKVGDWYDFYVNEFYLGPSSPPPNNILSVQALPGAYQFGDNRATLYFDKAAEEWQDEYTLRVVDEIRAWQPGDDVMSLWDRVASADPTAADRLDAMVRGLNIDSIYIFKTCDYGRSVTAHDDPRCEPSPARTETQEHIGFGHQAYAWMTPDSRDRFPRRWSDSRVPAGTTVIYTLVATTPGIILETKVPDASFQPPLVEIDSTVWISPDETDTIVVVDTTFIVRDPEWDVNDPTLEPGLRDTIIELVPPGRSSMTFRTGDPWTAQVYMPASLQTGHQGPRVELISEKGPLPFDYWQSFEWLDEHLSEASGRYRTVYGHQLVVAQYTRLPERVIDSTVVQLERRIPARMPDGAVTLMPYLPHVFTSHHPDGVPVRLHSGGDIDTFMDVDDSGNPVEVLVTRSITGTRCGVLLDVDAGELPVHAASFGTGNWWFTPEDAIDHELFPGFYMWKHDGTGSRNMGWELEGGDFYDVAWPSLTRTNTGWWPAAVTNTARRARWQMRFGAPVFGYYDQLPYVDIDVPENTVREFTEMMESRPRFETSEVNAAIVRAVRLDMPGYEQIEADAFVEIDLPFRYYNLQHGGNPRVAVLREDQHESIILGQTPDTVTVPVPPDRWTAWTRVILLEELDMVETNPDGTLKLDERGEPTWITDLRVTRNRYAMGCSSSGMSPSRQTCNPVRGPRRAATPGYIEVRPMGDPDFPEGMQFREVWRDRVSAQTEYIFDIHAARHSENVSHFTDEDLRAIRVVPNPYIAVNAFEHAGDVRRLMFTQLPPQGTIQIFTASGQFVQRLEWEPADLRANGDIFWDMTTREGTLIAAGLYLFVVETENPATGQKLDHMGKFVVIR